MFESYDPILCDRTFTIGGIEVPIEYYVCTLSNETWITPEQMDRALDLYNEMKADNGTE